MKKVGFFLLLLAFVLITPNVYASEVKTGTYRIHNANDDSKLLVEKDGNVELGDINSTGITTWNVYSDGNYYYIRSSDDSISLTSSGGAGNGVNINVNGINNSKNQKWQFVFANGNYYYIRSALGNYNVDVSAGHKELGTNIQIWSANTTNAQKWRLEKIDENPQVLDDGTYMIRANNNTDNVIDLSGASTNNSSNIQVFQRNYTWAQLWNIKYENGYYTIKTYLNDNKVMDVSAAIFKNCSNVQLYQANGTNAQKWILNDNGDGTYSFSSYDGLWKLDISAGSKKSGSNLQIYQTNGTAAQKFIFEKANIEYLENGYYTINSLLGTDMVVGINNSKAVDSKNVLLTKNTDFRYTKWYIKRISGDIYTIANAQNRNKVLDVYWGKTTDGSNIQLFESNGTAAQKWIIRKNLDNTYRIVGTGSSKSLDIAGASSSEGTNVQLWTSNDTNAQKFNITPVVQTDYELPDVDKYVIKSNLYQDKVVDISAASKDNNTNVQLWASNNTKAQIWKLGYLGEGKYTIRSMLNPNLVLTASSSNVVSNRYTGSENQKWYFYRDNSDNMTIYNIGQGKYLYMSGVSSGSNISLSDTQSSKNQVVLSQYNEKINYRGIDVSAHNGNIDWASIRNQVDFVIIRAGFSSEVITNGYDKYEDSKFLENVKKCEEYNIPYGFYLYSYAIRVNGSENSAESEADHILKLVRKAKNKGYSSNLSVPVYYDVEDPDYTLKYLDYGSIYQLENRFCSIVENNGYQCGIYMSLSPYESMGYNNTRDLASKYGIWVAHWRYFDFNPYEDQFALLHNPSGYYNHSHFESKFNMKEKLWQFSAEGNIPAANTGQGRIDLDVGYDIFE